MLSTLPFRTKALSLEKKCFLVIDNNLAVQETIKLSSDLKYILIDKTLNGIQNIKNIKNLADLENSQVYEKIVETFEFKL